MQLKIHVHRTDYSPKQVKRTMTVGELIEQLQQYDEDTRVYTSHDNGYTFGGITPSDFEEDYADEDEEEADDE